MVKELAPGYSNVRQGIGGAVLIKEHLTSEIINKSIQMNTI